MVLPHNPKYEMELRGQYNTLLSGGNGIFWENNIITVSMGVLDSYTKLLSLSE